MSKFIFTEWADVQSTQKGRRRRGQLFYPVCDRLVDYGCENTVQCEWHPGMAVICNECQMRDDLEAIHERKKRMDAIDIC